MNPAISRHISPPGTARHVHSYFTRSACARYSQSRRQVWNFLLSLKLKAISRLAYRDTRGERYRSTSSGHWASGDTLPVTLAADSPLKPLLASISSVNCSADYGE